MCHSSANFKFCRHMRLECTRLCSLLINQIRLHPLSLRLHAASSACLRVLRRLLAPHLLRLPHLELLRAGGAHPVRFLPTDTPHGSDALAEITAAHVHLPGVSNLPQIKRFAQLFARQGTRHFVYPDSLPVFYMRRHNSLSTTQHSDNQRMYSHLDAAAPSFIVVKSII